MPNGYPERDMPVDEESPPAYLDEVLGMLEQPQQPESAPQTIAQVPRGFGYGVVEKFNPDTGQRQTFTAVAPRTSLPQFPIPRPQRDPMEEMRKTINAIQFQKANDAYKAALSFQAARAYRQDLDAGKSQAEALARWGHLLPGGLAGAAAMTREATAGFVPTVTNLPGVGPVIRRGRWGEGITIPPPKLGEGPVKGVPVLNPDGTVNPNYFAAPGARGNWTLHPNKPEEPPITPSLRYKNLSDDIKTNEKLLQDLDKNNPKDKPEYDRLNSEIEAWRKERSAITHPKKKGEQPAAPNAVKRFRYNPATGQLEEK